MQARFMSLPAGLVLSEEPHKKEDLISDIQDAIKPSHLVHPEKCKKLPIHGKLKSFLEKPNVDVGITEEYGMVVAKWLICRI